MTVPVLSENDLAELAQLAPDLDFTDVERRAVLLASNSCDVNAAPGSGKTTLLAAKLLLLSRRWPHARKGICVLSHTNVARDEVQRRLGSSVEGSALLTYPHFIGTIHAFVNQFLALPYMRSTGYVVDVIDDEVFSRRAIAIANTNWSLRAYMQKNASVGPMIAGLVYRGAELAVASEDGKLPGPDAKTLPFILGIKQRLTEQGVYRYEDMFAFAERLLATSPEIKARLSQRFPLVFIDEMQDTSWAQESLLKLMFDDTVIVQRYGDVNQRILGSVAGSENLTFPNAAALPISSSKRFGPAIAKTVACAQLGGKPVVGEREDRHAPVLMTYTTEKVTDVIAAYGTEVLERFTDDELATGKVKALCARKQGDAQKALPGRTLLDYWPNFVDSTKVAGIRVEQFWSLLSGTGRAQLGAGTLSDRSTDIKRAILLVLRAAHPLAVANVKDPSQLLRRLSDAGFLVSPVRRLVRDLVVASGLVVNEAGRKQIPEMMFGALQGLLSEGETLARFTKLGVFAEPTTAPVSDISHKVCKVQANGRQLDVEIGSLASMKGETHLATLVLESHGHPSRRFDIAEALPIIAGLSGRDPKLKESQLSQYRNLYVGMSRPTSFLCLAANAGRVSDECKDALIELGWVVKHIS